MPVKVPLPDGVVVTGVSEGEGSSFAITSDGSFYAWGYGLDGELGNGSDQGSSTPIKVSLPDGAKALAVASVVDMTIALGSDGSIYVWGNNGSGELGNGSLSPPDSFTPVLVALPGQATATAVTAGEGSLMAIAGAGTVTQLPVGAIGGLIFAIATGAVLMLWLRRRPSSGHLGTRT